MATEIQSERNQIANNSFQTYFDAMPCYVIVQDRDFKIIEANQMFREDFGDPQGGYCYKIYKKRDEKCDECPVERTFQTGKKQGSEQVIRDKSGQDVNVVAYTSPIKNNRGDIDAVLAICVDITELKYLAGRLKESEAQNRLVFDEVPCYISIQDKDLRLVRTNRRFKEDFSEQLGGFCYEVHKYRSEPCIPCPVIRTFQDGKLHQSEEVVTSKHGEQVYVLVHTAPIRNAHNEITHVMEMSANITDIRKLQSQLTSLGLLVGTISHGIKGLITGLDGGMYLVNSGLKQDNQNRIKKGWEIIQRNVCRIRAMVFNILYYSKEREPEWEKASPLRIITDVCSQLESASRDLGIELRKDFAEKVSDFLVDPPAIHSMLVNLIENAMDACRKDLDKDKHWIEIKLMDHGDTVVYEVADNGIGMDRETREKAFSLFFSSKGVEGTGLGLFIANKIVQKHGGSVNINSTPNVGSRFTVSLPRNHSLG